MEKDDKDNLSKEQKNTEEIKNMCLIWFTMILIVVTFLFFKPINKWEWNWNNFLVGIYNQVLSLSLLFCLFYYLNLKIKY